MGDFLAQFVRTTLYSFAFAAIQDEGVPSRHVARASFGLDLLDIPFSDGAELWLFVHIGN